MVVPLRRPPSSPATVPSAYTCAEQEPRRFPGSRVRGRGVVSSERVECVARTAARTFETPKELLGIVAGEQLAVELFEQLDGVGGIASTAAACEPMAGIAPLARQPGPTLADSVPFAPFAFESARMAPQLHYYSWRGGRERNYG